MRQPAIAFRPPLARIAEVPMMTLLTRDMMAKIAESVMTVVAMFERARLAAIAWPL